MTKTLRGRRAGDVAVWQRVVPRAAVRILPLVSKRTRKLARNSMPRLNKSGEAGLIPLQDLEKVAGTLGEPRKDTKRGLSHRKQHSVLRFRCARNAATHARCHGRPIEKTKATRRSRAWSEFCGTSHDATRDSRALQEESAGVHVEQHRRKTTRRVQRGGRRARRIHERHVFFCRPISPCGRKAHNRAEVRSTRVLQDKVRDYAQGVEVSARLAAPVPISIAKALSVASVGSFGWSTCLWQLLFFCGDALDTERAGTTPQHGSDRGKEWGTAAATLEAEHRHQQRIQGSGRDEKKKGDGETSKR